MIRWNLLLYGLLVVVLRLVYLAGFVGYCSKSVSTGIDIVLRVKNPTKGTTLVGTSVSATIAYLPSC